MIKIRKAPVGMPDAERQVYVRYMTERHPEITSGTLDILLDGDDVELTLIPDTAVKFQRIRRITVISAADSSMPAHHRLRKQPMPFKAMEKEELIKVG